MANRLRRRTSDQTVLGSNPAVAAALSPWTRLFTPIVPRRTFTLASISYLAILVKYISKKKKKKKKVSMRVNQKKPRCPWMTPQLLQILHKQKSMYRRVVRSHRQDNTAILQHRLLRNTSNMYRQLQNEYFQTRLDDFRNSPAQLWSAINFITGRKNQHFPVSVSISDLETTSSHYFSILVLPLLFLLAL